MSPGSPGATASSGQGCLESVNACSQGKKSNLGSLMMVAVDKNTFSLVGDIPSLLDRAAGATIQPVPEDKAASDVLGVRNAQVRSSAAAWMACWCRCT